MYFAAQSSGGGGNWTLLLMMVLIFGLMYFMMIRPQRRRQREAQEMQASLSPGAEVMTTSGLYGTVTAIEDDTVMLEVAPGVEQRYTRAAVGKVLSAGPQVEDEDEPEVEPDDEPAASDDKAGHDNENADSGTRDTGSKKD